MVRKICLRRHVSGAVKGDFQPYIGRYTSPNEYFEYSYQHFNALLQFKLHKTARHPMNGDIINDANYFGQYISGYTVASFMLSNQTSRNKLKCIGIAFNLSNYSSSSSFSA